MAARLSDDAMILSLTEGLTVEATKVFTHDIDSKVQCLDHKLEVGTPITPPTHYRHHSSVFITSQTSRSEID
jgi:hypothetical protein